MKVAVFYDKYSRWINSYTIICSNLRQNFKIDLKVIQPGNRSRLNRRFSPWNGELNRFSMATLSSTFFNPPRCFPDKLIIKRQ